MSSTILIVCLILFMIIGIPVAFSLSWSGIFALLSKGEIPLLVFPYLCGLYVSI